jgi:cobalt transporter subunit CbtA
MIRGIRWRFPAIDAPMAAFRRLLCAALCAGLLCGALIAAAHQFGTVPLILAAETYEKPAAHAHEQAAAWEPENGFERTAYTAAADLLAAIGFALLLAAGFTLRGGEIGWRESLFWGLAGFAAFTLAPGLGLPPELPGSEGAPLLSRQLWWVATTTATAGGLALFAFTTRPRWALIAAVLIVLPHLYGAPQPIAAGAHGTAPDELARRFVVAATVLSFLFWAALGTSTGYFYRRFAAA